VNVGEVRIAWLIHVDGNGVGTRHQKRCDVNAIYRLSFRRAATWPTAHKVPVDPQLVAAVGRDEKLCLSRQLFKVPTGRGSKAEISFVQIEWVLRAYPDRIRREGVVQPGHAAYLNASSLITV
jgi:hypothetical protein